MAKKILVTNTGDGTERRSLENYTAKVDHKSKTYVLKNLGRHVLGSQPGHEPLLRDISDYKNDSVRDYYENEVPAARERRRKDAEERKREGRRYKPSDLKL